MQRRCKGVHLHLYARFIFSFVGAESSLTTPRPARAERGCTASPSHFPTRMHTHTTQRLTRPRYQSPRSSTNYPGPCKPAVQQGHDGAENPTTSMTTTFTCSTAASSLSSVPPAGSTIYNRSSCFPAGTQTRAPVFILKGPENICTARAASAPALPVSCCCFHPTVALQPAAFHSHPSPVFICVLPFAWFQTQEREGGGAFPPLLSGYTIWFPRESERLPSRLRRPRWLGLPAGA